MSDTVLVSPSGRIEAECVARALSSAGLNAHLGHPGQRPVAHVVVALDGVSVDEETRRAESLFGSRLPTLVLGQDLPLDSTTSAVAAALATVIGDSGRTGSRQSEPTSAPDVLARLSRRERQILLLVADGCTNEMIATELGISYHTVRTHVSHALEKLDVPHRHAAAMLVQHSRRWPDRLVASGARAGWAR